MKMDKLKELRCSNNITQSEFAKQLNVSRSSYAMWESGNETVPITHLISIADIFKVTIDYLFGLTDNIINYDFKNPDKIISGKRLKLIRLENKITQEKLANKLNTNRSVIANYERGRNYISTSFLYDLCKTYKVSADYILGRIDN